MENLKNQLQWNFVSPAKKIFQNISYNTGPTAADKASAAGKFALSFTFTSLLIHTAHWPTAGTLLTTLPPLVGLGITLSEIPSPGQLFKKETNPHALFDIGYRPVWDSDPEIWERAAPWIDNFGRLDGKTHLFAYMGGMVAANLSLLLPSLLATVWRLPGTTAALGALYSYIVPHPAVAALATASTLAPKHVILIPLNLAMAGLMVKELGSRRHHPEEADMHRRTLKERLSAAETGAKNIFNRLGPTAIDKCKAVVKGAVPAALLTLWGLYTRRPTLLAYSALIAIGFGRFWAWMEARPISQMFERTNDGYGPPVRRVNWQEGDEPLIHEGGRLYGKFHLTAMTVGIVTASLITLAKGWTDQMRIHSIYAFFWVRQMPPTLIASGMLTSFALERAFPPPSGQDD